MDPCTISKTNYPDVEEIGAICPHPNVLKIIFTLLSCNEEHVKELFQGAEPQGSFWIAQIAA